MAPIVPDYDWANQNRAYSLATPVSKLDPVEDQTRFQAMFVATARHRENYVLARVDGKYVLLIGNLIRLSNDENHLGTHAKLRPTAVTSIRELDPKPNGNSPRRATMPDDPHYLPHKCQLMLEDGREFYAYASDVDPPRVVDTPGAMARVLTWCYLPFFNFKLLGNDTVTMDHHLHGVYLPAVMAMSRAATDFTRAINPQHSKPGSDLRAPVDPMTAYRAMVKAANEANSNRGMGVPLHVPATLPYNAERISRIEDSMFIEQGMRLQDACLEVVSAAILAQDSARR